MNNLTIRLESLEFDTQTESKISFIDIIAIAQYEVETEGYYRGCVSYRSPKHIEIKLFKSNGTDIPTNKLSEDDMHEVDKFINRLDWENIVMNNVQNENMLPRSRFISN